MIKFIFSFFIFFWFTEVYSQNELSGTVYNESGEIVSFANIQVISNDKIISYGTSNAEGKYLLSFSEFGKLILKVTHILYLSIEESISFEEESNKIFKDITLVENPETLEEVTLKFEPKVMEIDMDTITYNLKALTDGSENSLADVMEKLPGVRIEANGQISVNGKVIKKMLIDGEELFKKQHRLTAESITSEMVEGIRYLDKFKDFGNVQGFENKQMRALDISIKEEYKNKITGDIKISGGHREKALVHTNLYRLGGEIKVGFIGDWNNLGKQSITSYEYEQLIESSDSDDFSSSGLGLSNRGEQTYRFFDPTVDVSIRENTFGALSLIYKPKDNFKISLLNIASKTSQKQRFFLFRDFFENENANLQENRRVQSAFFLNSSILELGYQPSPRSFISYTGSYHPSDSEDDLDLTTLQQNTQNTFLQKSISKGWTIDQKLSYLTKFDNKTLFKISGIAILDQKNQSLAITGERPFLGIVFSDDFMIKQFQDQNNQKFGYEAQLLSNFGDTKLNFRQGILRAIDIFENQVEERNAFDNRIETDRNDSYLGFTLKNKLNKKLFYTIEGEYRYLFYKRLGESFEDYFLLPSFNLDYHINTSKQLSIQYKYDFQIARSEFLNVNKIIQNYFTSSDASDVDVSEIFPSHSLQSTFLNIKSTTGSSFFLFADYNHTSRFLTTNSFVDQNNSVILQNITGKNRNTFIFGNRADYRIRKWKVNVFVNSDYMFTEEENQINSQNNIATTDRFSQKIGFYSRFRNKPNFSMGVDYSILNYRTTVGNVSNRSSSIKPYIYFTGNAIKKKMSWSLGGEYAFFKTDNTETNIFNLQPTINYELSDDWRFSLEGNNILNINSAEITENINNVNFTESRISETLQGYLVVGIYYRIK